MVRDSVATAPSRDYGAYWQHAHNPLNAGMNGKRLPSMMNPDRCGPMSARRPDHVVVVFRCRTEGNALRALLGGTLVGKGISFVAPSVSPVPAPHPRAGALADTAHLAAVTSRCCRGLGVDIAHHPPPSESLIRQGMPVRPACLKLPADSAARLSIIPAMSPRDLRLKLVDSFRSRSILPAAPLIE